MLGGGLRWGQHDVDAEGVVLGRVESEDLVDDGGGQGAGQKVAGGGEDRKAVGEGGVRVDCRENAVVGLEDHARPCAIVAVGTLGADDLQGIKRLGDEGIQEAMISFEGRDENVDILANGVLCPTLGG